MADLKCRIPDEMAKELKIEIAKRGTSTQTILQTAVEEFLYGKSKSNPGHTGSSAVETVYQDFLNNGDPTAVEIVKNLIATYSRTKKSKVQGRKVG